MTCAVHLGQAAKQPLFLRGRVRLSCHQDSSKLLVDARVIACVGTVKVLLYDSYDKGVWATVMQNCAIILQV